MAYTKEQLEPRWKKDQASLVKPLVKGQLYLGMAVPDQIYSIQEWCLDQGSAPFEEDLPDLSLTFRGLEGLLVIASGKYTNLGVFTEKNIQGTMPYLMEDGDFVDGALRQFPELQAKIHEALLELPAGQQVIEIIQNITIYSDLFQGEATK